MQRRKFGREFKIEAVRLVRERGVSIAQAARNIDIHETVLNHPREADHSGSTVRLPGQGQMKPEQVEIDRLRTEVARLKAERDIF